MSSLNLSAQRFIFTLNGDDWTRWVSPEGITISNPEYSIEGGLVLTEAKLKLVFQASDQNTPSNINPRVNRAYWGRGAIATIRIDENFLPLSGQKLYILNSPQAPYSDTPDGTLSLDLQLGNTLVYNSFSEPIDINETGIIPGVLTSRESAVLAILNKRNIQNVGLSPFPYPLNFAVASTVKSETPVQLAGAIAASAGYFLYTKSDGSVYSDSVKVTPSTPVVTLDYSLSGSVKIFKPIGELSEVPAEKLIIEAIYNELTPQNISSIPVTENTYSTLGASFPDTNPSFRELLFLSRQVITTVVGNQTTVITRLPLGIVFPDTISTLQTLLIDAEVAVSESFYDSEFKLNSVITKSKRPTGIVFPDTISTLQTLLIDADIVEQKYFYQNSTVSEIKKTAKRPLGIVFPDTNSTLQTLLIDAEVETKTWQKQYSDKYKFETIVYRPQGILFPDTPVSFQTQLIIDTQVSSTSNDGQDFPPSPTRQAPENNFKEIPLKATVTTDFGYPVLGRSRIRKISLDHAVSVAQLENYGRLFNGLIAGRSQGWVVVARLDSVFLDDQFRPFCQVDVTANGYKYLLKVDAISFVLTQKECYVAFNGIEVGIQKVGIGGGGIIGTVSQVFVFSGTIKEPAPTMKINRTFGYGELIEPAHFMRIGFLAIGGSTLVISDTGFFEPLPIDELVLNQIKIEEANIDFVIQEC
jgi:hypothetical protein